MELQELRLFDVEKLEPYGYEDVTVEEIYDLRENLSMGFPIIDRDPGDEDDATSS